MSTIEPTKDIKALHSQVKMLLDKKYTEEAIVDELKKQGLEPYYIETIIGNVENETADKKSFRNCMIMGFVYIIGGLLINVFSYTIAENSNATFFYIFLGTIVLGIITIARGFILYKR